MNTDTDFSQLSPANLFRRIAALIYDIFLLMAISLVYGTLLTTLAALHLLPQQSEGVDIYEPITRALVLLGWWATLSYYYCYCWVRRGQTLAMKSWRIRLQQLDGSLITYKQAWLRAILAPISLLSVVGYLWCLVSQNKDCLHDELTATRLVSLPKNIN